MKMNETFKSNKGHIFIYAAIQIIHILNITINNVNNVIMSVSEKL